MDVVGSSATKTSLIVSVAFTNGGDHTVKEKQCAGTGRTQTKGAVEHWKKDKIGCWNSYGQFDGIKLESVKKWHDFVRKKN